MNDVLIYLTESVIWSILGFVLGTAFGWYITKEGFKHRGEPQPWQDSRVHRANIWLGILLMVVGTLTILNSFAANRKAEAQHVCLAIQTVNTDDAIKAVTARNLEESAAYRTFIESLRHAHVNVADPGARDIVDSYFRALDNINLDRVRTLRVKMDKCVTEHLLEKDK